MNSLILLIVLCCSVQVAAFKTLLYYRQPTHFPSSLCNKQVKRSHDQRPRIVPTSAIAAHKNGISHQAHPAKSIVTRALLLMNLITFIWTARNTGVKMRLLKSNFHIARGDWYRVITALFVHGNLGHLAMNSLSLSSLGPQVSILEYKLPELPLLNPFATVTGGVAVWIW